MNLNLSGKTALVCGSSQGLGLASAIELALLGANVVLMARDEAKLKVALNLLNADSKQNHSYLVADFNDSNAVKTVIDKYISEGNTIDILINNTGGPAAGRAIDAKPSDYLQAFNNHLICNQILTQAVTPGMINSGYGRIINIISTSVMQPIYGLGVSNTIRAAVANWGKTLSFELGRFGITVNNVLPGFTDTVRADYVVKKKVADSGLSEEKVMEGLLSKIPVGRMGSTEEFGSVVAFLCSPAASYVNGVNLPVDGGRTGWL